MIWLERMIRRRRVRRNLCPKGHGSLKSWDGQMRCWTCGWTPFRGVSGKGVRAVVKEYNAVCWTRMINDDDRQIARELFKRIQSVFSQLQMTLNLDPRSDDVSLDIPLQQGVSLPVKIDLLDDGLRIFVGQSVLEWCPCGEGFIQEEFLNAACGVLSGRLRVLEHYRGTRAIKAELQEPYDGGWNTVETWATFHWPFPWRITNREIWNMSPSG